MDDSYHIAPDAELSYANLSLYQYRTFRRDISKLLDSMVVGSKDERALKTSWYSIEGFLRAELLVEKPALTSAFALRISLYGENARDCKERIAKQYRHRVERMPEEELQHKLAI